MKQILYFFVGIALIFLMGCSHVPLSPFLYIDTNTDEKIRLELPEYYQFKKEMSAFGFSSSIIYSFIIKSHFWSVLKAPFTTTHRLAAVGTSSAQVMLQSHIFDLSAIPPLILLWRIRMDCLLQIQ